jgi:glycosyltransferase involved in cell wall biosynthesis
MISVVIPTYQRPESLARAVASVRAQTYPDVELRIVGDGEMPVLADRGPYLTLYHAPRQDYGPDAHAFWCSKGVNARNLGLDMAKGEWVLPLDDDDELEPDAIASLLDASEGFDVVYGRSCVEGVGLLGSWPPRPSGFVNGAVMWRASLDYRYRPDTSPAPADWDLWSRMLSDGTRWTFVDRVVHHYYPADRVPQVDAA